MKKRATFKVVVPLTFHMNLRLRRIGDTMQYFRHNLESDLEITNDKVLHRMEAWKKIRAPDRI